MNAFAMKFLLLLLLFATLTYAGVEQQQASHHHHHHTKVGMADSAAAGQQQQQQCVNDVDNNATCGAATEANAQVVDDDDEDEEEVISEAAYQATSPAMRAFDETGGDMGVKQVIDQQYQDRVKAMINEARTYVTDIVNKDPDYEGVKSICKHQHELCAFWAVLGECDKNPSYMHINCAPVCQTCDLLDIKKRCPMDPDAKDALYPGDLDTLFETILTNPEYAQYEPHAVSRPTLAPGDVDEANVDYKVGGPWMVVFENVLSADEAAHLRQWGFDMGYKRSEDVGTKKADGTYTSYSNSGRTSTNSWCTDACYEDATNQRIMDRIANITGIPEVNSENLQLLRYQEGQFYQTHSDYIPFQRERQAGVRILTFYMYLNDLEPEQGGGTNFPRLDLTVQPKLGRAVLWPSVRNDQPNVKDVRSDHQAMPVIGADAVKYGANAWIHQRNYKGPNSVGC